MQAASPIANLPELTVQQAEVWTAAVLAREHALRQHEDSLFPDPKDAAAMQLATQLRETWRHWVDEAEGLLRHIEPLLSAKRHVAGSSDLEFCIARARYITETTPELIQQRRDQVARGEVVTTEELRRELLSSQKCHSERTGEESGLDIQSPGPSRVHSG